LVPSEFRVLAASIEQILRVPFVHVRALVGTPAWWPAIGWAGFVSLAWFQQLHFPAEPRRDRLVEGLGFVFGAAALLWFFHIGQFSWDQNRDWQKDWTYYAALKQAVARGEMPYYLSTGVQSTERYFSNLETVVAPHAVLLRVMSIRSFFMLHVLILFGIGYWALIALKRELGLSAFSWVVFLTLFLFNGHITGHLGVGHTQWVTYFLLPWLLLCLVRAARGNCSTRNAGTLACALAAMIFNGGWHVFVWSFLFTAFFGLTSPSRMAFFVKTVFFVAPLAALRLMPALLTFGGGSNVFLGSFRSLSILVEALVGGPESSTGGLDWWEYDTYVGYVGLLVLCVGAIPAQTQRWVNGLLAASAGLFILSMFGVYEHTLFNLPGLVSERVVTRFAIIPVLTLSLIGCVRLDGWAIWHTSRPGVGHVASLFAAWFLVVQLALRAEGWRPSTVVTGLPLPTDVLKEGSIDRLYFWSVWAGGAVSVISFAALVIFVFMPRRVERHDFPP
jgi:hypothetical protein